MVSVLCNYLYLSQKNNTVPESHKAKYLLVLDQASVKKQTTFPLKYILTVNYEWK